MKEHPIDHRTRLLVGPDAMDALAGVRVILFGVGGVGSWCAEALVRSGVQHLTLVDSDLVCVTNVNRQLQALPGTVGRPKVRELQARCQAIRPGADVVAVQEVFDVRTKDRFELASYDYVLDAIDTLSPKIELILATREAGTTLFSAMGAGAKLDPTQLRVASIWESERCPLSRLVRKRLRRRGFAGDFLCVYSKELVENHPTAPVCGTERCFCPKYRDPERAAEAHEWCSTKATINGSVVHVTATAGMFLAGLVFQDVVRRAARSDVQTQ